MTTNETLLRLRYIVYQLAEDFKFNSDRNSRRAKAEEAYSLIDGQIGLIAADEKSFADLTPEQKAEFSARPYQSPAEKKTIEMLSNFEGPTARLSETAPPVPQAPVFHDPNAEYPKTLGDESGKNRDNRGVNNSTEEAAARAEGFTRVVAAPRPAHPAAHAKPKP